jgi:hypothetical protein
MPFFDLLDGFLRFKVGWVRIEKAVGKIKPPKRGKVEQENSIVR